MGDGLRSLLQESLPKFKEQNNHPYRLLKNTANQLEGAGTGTVQCDNSGRIRRTSG